MGQRFYEAAMPKMADQLGRLNANLEALLAELWKRGEARTNTQLRRGPTTRSSHPLKPTGWRGIAI